MFIIQIISIAVWIIIGLKIVFIVSTLLDKYVNYNKKSVFYLYDDKLVRVKKISDFLFVISMSLLIIFIFNPKKNNMQYFTPHIKLLLYLFGAIIIITADWSDFFTTVQKKHNK